MKTRLTAYLILLLLICAARSPVLAQTQSDTAREAQRLARVAQVAQHEGRLNDAIKAYQTIAVIAGSSPAIAASAYLNLGNICMGQRKFDEAAAAFRRALSLDQNSAEAHNNLGEALGELRQYQNALQAFQQAIALDSTHLKARYNMGVTYDRLGQLSYAQFVYRILIRDHPDFALAYDSMAVTLSKSGRASEAIPFHQKAVTLSSRDPSFFYNFAVSYLILGDLKKAQEQQQKVRELDPAMAEHLAVLISKRPR